MRTAICTDRTATSLKQQAFRLVSTSDALYEDGHHDLAEAVAKAAKLLATSGVNLEERLAAAEQVGA